WGKIETQPSRKYSAGIINLRPDRDGEVIGVEGVDYIREKYGECIIDWNLPGPGTATQTPDAGYMANAWMRLRHPDYDTLRDIMNDVGESVQVRAR
ncbi:MAG: ATPase, partial [Gemmatimonadetes bacterium]|nr:ATPase [Gemmatimonadota bacterium]